MVVDETQAKLAPREDALHGGVDLLGRCVNYPGDLQRTRRLAQETGRHRRRSLLSSFNKDPVARFHERTIKKFRRDSGFFRSGPDIREAVSFDLHRVGGMLPGNQLSRPLFEAASGLGLQFGRTPPERVCLLLGNAGFVLAHGTVAEVGRMSAWTCQGTSAKSFIDAARIYNTAGKRDKCSPAGLP